jgi:hypothetical protein
MTRAQGSRSSCTSNQFRTSDGRSGRAPSVPAQIARRSDSQVRGVRGLAAQGLAARDLGVPVPRVRSAARVGLHGHSQPAAASHVQAELGRAASRANDLSVAEAAPGPERAAVDHARERIPGPASAQSGLLLGVRADRSLLVPRDHSLRAPKALRDSGPAAKSPDQNARPAQGGSRSRTSAANPSPAAVIASGPSRADSPNPAPKGRASRVRRAAQVANGADRLRAKVGPAARSAGRGPSSIVSGKLIP